MGRNPLERQRRALSYHGTAAKVQICLLAFAFTALCSACGRNNNTQAGPDPVLADTLKGVIQDAYDFSRPNAVERMGSLYADRESVVSASGGRIIATPDSIRKGIATFWENVGRNMKGPRWKWNQVFVQRLGENAATLTGTWSVPHIAPDNHPHTISGAWTAVFVRIDGRWRIVQEHLSSS